MREKKLLANPRLLLAHHLVVEGIGGHTVDELNETMTVREFLRWESYDDMFPVSRVDLQFAHLRRLIASAYSKKGKEPKLESFLIGKFPEEKTTAGSMKLKMQAMATQLRGKK